jgi:hydroxypyruvate reductase
MTIPANSFLTRSLREKPWGYQVSRILAASLAAVDPYTLIQEDQDVNRMKIPGIDVDDYQRIFVLGIGKAALPMSISIGDLLGNRLTEGMILTKEGYDRLPERFQGRMQVFPGGHPIPDKRSQQSTAEILSRLTPLKEDDLVIILISGGSSALFTKPAEGISLSDLQKTNQALISCGADIREINTIRKHLSQIKGGQLAQFLQPARIYTLILSDVIGDHVDLVGSGPTAPDPSTFADALEVVEKYHLEHELPTSVISRLNLGMEEKIPETPKTYSPLFPEQYDPIFMEVTNLVLASIEDALQAGVMQAAIEGFAPDKIPFPLVGEAKQVGKDLAQQLTDMARKNKPLRRPACLIGGGETTVTLRSTREPGQGGRNLELALSAMPVLDGLSNVALITLATDGEDGSTYAAGAVVTGESYQRCQELGLNPAEYLQRHDAYTIFKKLDDLIVTGPTGTNVNDLCFLFTF